MLWVFSSGGSFLRRGLVVTNPMGLRFTDRGWPLFLVG